MQAMIAGLLRIMLQNKNIKNTELTNGRIEMERRKRLDEEDKERRKLAYENKQLEEKNRREEEKLERKNKRK